MKIKLLGIENQDYKLDNGFAFKGKKLHALDIDTQLPGQIGNQVLNIKIPDDSPSSSVPLEVGQTYTVYFTPKGKLDTIFVSK